MNSIYKYINFPKEKEDQIIDSIFIKNQLHYQDPFKFNDPYDCEVSFKAEEMEKEELAHFLTNFILPCSRDLKLDFNSKQLSDLVLNNRDNISNNLIDYFNKQINDTILYIKRNVRISCFSKDPQNVAMWGYYANGHRGIVLEYYQQKIKAINDYNSLLSEVSYHDSHPKPLDLDYTNINKVQMDVFLRKSKDWEHEQEVRNILNMNFVDKDGLAKMKENTIKSVIFGYRVDPNLVRKIVNIIHNKSLDIKLKAIIQDKHVYKLKIEDVTDINEYYFNNIFNNDMK